MHDALHCMLHAALNAAIHAKLHAELQTAQYVELHAALHSALHSVLHITHYTALHCPLNCMQCQEVPYAFCILHCTPHCPVTMHHAQCKLLTAHCTKQPTRSTLKAALQPMQTAPPCHHPAVRLPLPTPHYTPGRISTSLRMLTRGGWPTRQ